MKIAAIDPGLKGAIVLLPDEFYIPPLVGNKIDLTAYAELFEKLRGYHVALEEVHAIPGTSAASNFTFGGMFFAARALLHAKGIRHTMVPPKQWQAEIWTSTDKVYKPGKKKKTLDTKATSLLAFKRLFPEIKPLYAHNEENLGRRSVFHDGIVDAFLIAEYLKRRG